MPCQPSKKLKTWKKRSTVVADLTTVLNWSTDSSMHSRADGRVVGGRGDVNGIHAAASPRPATLTVATRSANSAPSVPPAATIVINAASPAPVRAPLSQVNGVVSDPAQISATRLLELMSGKQQSPKNEAERDILVRTLQCKMHAYIVQISHAIL